MRAIRTRVPKSPTSLVVPPRTGIRLCLFFTVLLGTLFLAGCDLLSTDPDRIVLEMNPASLDFGEVDRGTSMDLTLEVRNSSNSNNRLEYSVTVSGPGFSVVSGGEGGRLGKGERSLITLRFTPGSEGVSTGSLIVTHNATDSPSPASVSLVGVGRDVIEMSLSRASIPFGTVLMGQTRDETFTISNSSNSTGPLIGDVTESSEGYSIVSGGGAFSLSPGQSKEVTVRFAPTAALPYAGSIAIAHNAKNALSPSSVSLTGVASHVIEMSLSRSAISFGTVALDQFGEETFVISNSANSTGSLNGSLTPSGSDFSIAAGGESFSLSPGQSRTVTVRFAPTSIGEISGSVSIAHNATNTGIPTVVSLTGTGTQLILMTLSRTSVEFGAVAIGQTRDETFEISNSASSTSSLSASPGVTGTGFSIVSGGGPFKIGPGESRTVTIRFAPTSTGLKAGSVSITHNATDTGSPATVALSGTGSQPIIMFLNRTAIDFGKVPLGMSRDETFEIRNFASSAGPLTGAVTVSGTEFSILGGGGAFSINPGEARTITVRFSPNSTGTKSGSVSITHDATNLSSPASVALSGTEGQWILMNLDRDSISFGTVSIGQTRDSTFTITNPDTSTGNLTGEVTEDSSAFSILSGGGTFSITPGGSRIVTIRFSPTAVGIESGTVTITHNADNLSSPSAVTLTGSGSQPILMSLDKASVKFGNVPMNQTLDSTFLISNSASSVGPLSGNVTVSGSRFSIVSGGEGAFELNPGQSWAVTVRYAPIVLGADTGSVSISHNATNLSSPTVVPLAGIGGQPILMSLNKSSIAFGDVATGQTVDVTFLISNSAASLGALVGNVSLSGTDFSILGGGGGPFVLNPGQTWVVTVRFAPASVGLKTGSVNITHNAGNMTSPSTVGLTGTGILPLGLMPPI